VAIASRHRYVIAPGEHLVFIACPAPCFDAQARYLMRAASTRSNRAEAPYLITHAAPGGGGGGVCGEVERGV